MSSSSESGRGALVVKTGSDCRVRGRRRQRKGMMRITEWCFSKTSSSILSTQGGGEDVLVVYRYLAVSLLDFEVANAPLVFKMKPIIITRYKFTEIKIPNISRPGFRI